MLKKPESFFKRTLCRIPTWRGWVLILVVVTIAGAGILFAIHPFLAVHQPIAADILVVEGWVPDYDLAEIKGEFDRGRYKRILATGLPLEHGSFLSSYKTYADLAAATLVRMGVRPERVVAVPGRQVRNDRTFASALALRDWLKTNDPSVRSVNVATKAVHARRSRLLFEKALGPGVAVGVIALPDYEYDPARWWRSSAGVKAVLTEGIGYLYVRLVP